MQNINKATILYNHSVILSTLQTVSNFTKTQYFYIILRVKKIRKAYESFEISCDAFAHITDLYCTGNRYRQETSVLFLKAKSFRLLIISLFSFFMKYSVIRDFKQRLLRQCTTAGVSKKVDRDLPADHHGCAGSPTFLDTPAVVHCRSSRCLKSLLSSYYR